MDSKQPYERSGSFWKWLVVAFVLGLGFLVGDRKGLFGRGVDYYYPQWTWGEEASQEEMEARRLALRQVTTGLPVMLKVFENEPSRIGEKWEELKGRMPEEIGEWMPRYSDKDGMDAAFWLARNSGDNEVVAAIRKRWRGWPDFKRAFYISILDLQRSVEFAAVSSMIVESLGSTNEALATSAASYVSAQSPLPPEAYEPLANLIDAWSDRGVEREQFEWALIAKNLARHDSLPGPVQGALERAMHGRDAMLSVLSSFVLASVSPERYPPETLSKSTLLKLNEREMEAFLRRAFRIDRTDRDLSGTAYFQDLLVDILPRWDAPDVSSQHNQDVIRHVFEALRRAGSPSAPNAKVLGTWITESSRQSSALLAAYLKIAPTDVEAATVLLPLLNERAYSADVLLWFTRAGTNLFSLQNPVAAVARDEPVTARAPSSRNVRGIMRRSSGFVQNSDTPRPQDVSLRPSQTRIMPSEIHSKELLKFWPGFVAGTNAVGTRSSSMPLKPVSLQLLARRALASLRGEPLPGAEDSPEAQ
jgi:hypothetical protein